MAGNIYI